MTFPHIFGIKKATLNACVMKVQIILQGKVKNKRTTAWIEDYQKRLANHTPLELVEWGAPQQSREERFFNSLKPGDRTVALDEGGKSFTTRGFAKYLEELLPVCRTLYLFVGEATGHSDTVLKHVTERWSLSNMTMSYEIALVVLAEQLYRCMTIRTGHPYHK